MTQNARIKLIRKVVTVDTNAYADEDRLGSIITFSDALNVQRQGIIRSVTVIWESGTPTQVVLWLFRALPTIASADNAAFDITDEEMAAKYLGHLNVPVTANTNLVNSASNSAASIFNIGLAVDSTDGNLYGVFEAQGAVTFTATDDLVVILGVETV